MSLRRMVAASLVAAAVVFGAAQAQEANRIAAVVNDEAITLHDLEMRTRMVILSSNLADSVELRRRVMPQVLRKLIDERIQVQEALRLKIAVTPNEIESGVARIEQQNGMAPGTLDKLLRQNGIDPATSREQIKAELAWLKILRLGMLPSIKVGEEEVETRLQAMRAERGQPEYLLAEILLPVDGPAGDADTRKLAERLIEDLRAGTPFANLAREFSQGPGAARGGDVGWTTLATLDEELRAPVAALRPGQVTAPIRSSQGYHILALRELRQSGMAAAAAPAQPERPQPAREGGEVQLAQLLLSYAPRMSDPDRAAVRARLDQASAGLAGCADLERRARELNAPQSGNMGRFRIGDLPDKLRPVVAALKPGEASKPIEGPEGVRVVMVCGRSGEAAAPPPRPATATAEATPTSREEVRRRIESERLDLIARRHLRDLRRAAFVDVRL